VSNWLYRIVVRTALAQRERTCRSSPAGSLESFLPRFDEKGDLATPAANGAGPPGNDVRDGAAEDDLAAPAPSGSSAQDRAGPGAGLAGAAVSEGLLREALDCIDDGVRAAFVLCDLADVPAEDAADILRIPPGVVRRRIHRARLMLRGFLDGS
jgi:DNA-directed RNA polymerase specialized sigma24 family protein